jgi:uncharacterized protein
VNAADEILRTNEAELQRLCRKYAVRRLEVFGSATSDKFDAEKSDLDFLADFDEPPEGMDLVEQYFDLHAELESLFKRRVDLVELCAVKNPYFLRAIELHRKVLYAA